MEKRELKKIVWAVDAFGETAVNERMASALRALVKQTQAKVVPVYILTPQQFGLQHEHFPDWSKAYLPSAQRLMGALVKEHPIAGLQDPIVITENTSSLREAVDRLVEVAGEQKADLIAVSTRANKLSDRFLIGTFAETLLLHSNVPVYVTNPESVSRPEISKILFATDFSEGARLGFDQMLAYAKTVGASVTVFHKTTTPPSDSALAAVTFMTALEQARDAAKVRGEEWVGYARNFGVKADLLLEQAPGSVATAIWRNAAEKSYSMIAMVGQTGALASYILGSATRQVVRGAPCPVWVLHLNK